MDLMSKLKQSWRTLTMVFALVAIWLIFQYATDGAFLQPRNMSNLFRQINNLFDTIRYEATNLRNNMKTYGKRISHTTLAEKVFEPKPQHVSWFQTAAIQTPCTISTFLTAILATMAAESRIDKQERSVTLTEAEAALFELTAGTHKWTDVLQRLPNVFL
jgi:lipoate-protein ligase A